MIVIEELSPCTFMDCLRPQSPPKPSHARVVSFGIAEPVKPPQVHKSVTEAQALRMLELRKHGYRLKDLARKYEVSPSYVRRLMIRMGAK